MRVQLILEAIDKATAPIRAVRDAVTGLNEAARKAATVERVQAAQKAAARQQAEAQSNMVGVMATAASVAAPIAKAVKEMNSYEDILTDVGLKADLAGPKLVALGERMRAQARSLNTSSTDILKGLDQLAAGGLEVSAAEQAIPGVIKAHIATKAAIDDLSKSTVTLINNMKVLPAETQLALDVMAKAGKEGQFELNDMARYFPRLGAQYAAMGQTGVKAVGDIAAALQVIRSQTGTSESAAVALEDVLNKISLGPAKKKFADLGIDIVKVMNDAQKSGNVIETIVETLKKATGGDANKLKDIFGDKQALSGARALMQEYDKFIAIRERAMGGAGTVNADFLTRMGLGVEKARALDVAFTELWITLGKTLAPQLNDKVDKIVAIVNAIEAWVKANPELAANIAMAAAAIVSLLVAMAAAKLALAVFRTGLIGLLGAFLKFNAAGRNVSLFARLGRVFMMLLAPARILGAVLFSFFSGLIGGIQAGVAAVGGWGTVLSALFGRLGALLRFLLSPLALLSRAFIALGVSMMATPVGWIIAGIAAIAAGAYLIYRNWDRIGPWLSQIWASIGNAMSSGWQSVTAWFSALEWPKLPSFSQALGDIFAPILSALATAWNAVADWFKSSIKWPDFPEFPDIAGMIEKAFDGTITKLSEQWTAVKTWFSDNFKWPELPEFKLPSMPNVSGWFSGDKTPATPNNEAKPVQTLAEVSAVTEQANAAKAAIDALAPAAQTVVAAVSSIFASANFHDHGVAMMRTLADGIKAGASTAVAAARSTVQEIRDHLPHSPARVGPLSDLDRVQFGQTLATAIHAGAPRALAAAHAIAAGLAASIPVAGVFAVGAEAAPGIAAPQANFARATPAVKGDGETGVSSNGPISVNLTLSPHFSASGSSDFIQQLRGALPNIGYELAEAIRAELDRRDRTKH